MSELLADNERLGLPDEPIITDVVAPTEELEIPLAARLSFVDVYDQHDLWLSSKEIGERINTSDVQVYRLAKFLHIPREPNNQGVYVYPPFTQAVIHEELIWRKTFFELPTKIRLATIIEQVGRSDGWTVKKLHELGVQPSRRTLESGRVVELYPKGVLKEFRKINMAVPMDGDWLTLGQLSQYTGAKREWIEYRLDEPERRRSSSSGRVCDYYPPKSLQIIQQELASRPQPGGDWLTATAIASRINRSENWIKKRLEAYVDLAEMRLDDAAVQRLHYPPQIIQILSEESSRLHSLPERGDYLSLKQIARQLGHAAAWAAQQVDELGIQPELRTDKLGRTSSYYPPSTIDQLAQHEAKSQTVKPDQLLESLYCIGSLESRLRANQSLARTLRSFGREDSRDQLQELAHQRKMIRQSLSRQQDRHDTLLGQVETLPGFIENENS